MRLLEKRYFSLVASETFLCYFNRLIAFIKDYAYWILFERKFYGDEPMYLF